MHKAGCGAVNLVNSHTLVTLCPLVFDNFDIDSENAPSKATTRASTLKNLLTHYVFKHNGECTWLNCFRMAPVFRLLGFNIC